MALAPVTPRRERNALETKRRILEAAEGEFAAKGFDGARLGTIARAASVQQALIHHYFGDKEGLHGEVVRSGLAAMTEGVWELLSRMDTPTKGKAKVRARMICAGWPTASSSSSSSSSPATARSSPSSATRRAATATARRASCT